VLVGLRDYQDEKADVILKCAAVEGCQARASHVASACSMCVPTRLCVAPRYMADEARSLKAYGELPENSARPALGGLCLSRSAVECEAPEHLMRDCSAGVVRRNSASLAAGTAVSDTPRAVPAARPPAQSCVCMCCTAWYRLCTLHLEAGQFAFARFAYRRRFGYAWLPDSQRMQALPLFSACMVVTCCVCGSPRE